MRIYLAARYSQKNAILEIARLLESDGHQIISDWHLEYNAPDVKIQDLPSEEIRQLAEKDILQIVDSEVMIFFAEHPDTPTVRGGRHVEFGLALSYKVPILVVGEMENIFHYLPHVQHFPTFQHVRDTLALQKVTYLCKCDLPGEHQIIHCLGVHPKNLKVEADLYSSHKPDGALSGSDLFTLIRDGYTDQSITVVTNYPDTYIKVSHERSFLGSF